MYETTQHFLTQSITDFALIYGAILLINFILGLIQTWQSLSPIPEGICAATLAPIFDDINSASIQHQRIINPSFATIVRLNFSKEIVFQSLPLTFSGIAP